MCVRKENGMKILAIADIEETALWDLWTPRRTEGVELILSCGDLRPEYLEFLVTVVNVPLLYVRGNHDSEHNKREPEGCICIDGKVYKHRGIRFMGLGGSRRYRPGEDQYTESEMRRRALKLMPAAAISHGIDVLVTHAPAAGYGDLDDLPHRGFETFNRVMDRYKPAYMLHGHVHTNYGRIEKEHLHPSGTKVLNVCGHQIIEL